MVEADLVASMVCGMCMMLGCMLWYDMNAMWGMWANMVLYVHMSIQSFQLYCIVALCVIWYNVSSLTYV